jgi:protein TonB
MIFQRDRLLAFTAALLLHGGLGVGLVWISSSVGRGPLPNSSAEAILIDIVDPAAAEAVSALSSLPESRMLPIPAFLPEVDRLVPPEPDAIVLSPVAARSAVGRIDPLSLVSPPRAPVLTGLRTTGPPGGSSGARHGDWHQPTALSEISPRYPVSARAGGQEGSVTVRIRVSAEGRTESQEVVRSSGVRSLDKAAIDAVRSARFAPAERGERRVAGEIDLTFEFRLKD